MAATTWIRTTSVRQNTQIIALRFVCLTGMMAIWQLLSISGLFFRDVVPPLQSIAAGLIALLASGAFYANLVVTGIELFLALAISVPAGIAIGVLVASKPLFSEAYEPWLGYLGPTPKIILFPVMIMLFGVDYGSKVAMGAVSAFFPIAISVAAGIRGVNPTLRRVGYSLQAKPLEMLLKIELPAMAASLVNGIRLGVGVAIIGVLLAETKLSNQGIGFMIINAYTRFDMPQMYALLIVTITFAAAINAFADRVARDLGGTNSSRSG